MKRYGVLMSLLVVGLAQSAWAASPGTVLIDPFDPGVSAAVSGMGGASSTMGGIWALTYNPAGLADVKDRPEATFYEFQVGASYLKWFEDQAVGYGTVALPPGFALGVANFDQGQITSQTGFFTGGTEKVSDFGAIGGYGTSLPGQLSNVDVGISAQFWQRNLASFKASTFAVNLGARAMFLEKQFAVGAYVQNLGPSLKFETSEEDQQPMGYTVGASWTMPKKEGVPVGVRLAADGIKYKDRKVYVGGGAEVILQDVLALRAGANTARDKTQPTFGVGVIYKGFTFDYAYNTIDLAGESLATHLVSLKFGLGEVK